MTSTILRFSAFLIAAALLLAIVMTVQLVGLTALVEQLSTPSVFAAYKPQLSVPALIVWILSIKALFNLIVSRKPTRHHLVALIFYIACNALGLGFALSGYPELEPVFGWIGIVGLAGYYLLRRFKKPMLPAQETTDSTAPL